MIGYEPSAISYLLSAKSTSGVITLVNLLQSLSRNMRIDLGRGDVRMAEHELDRPQVCPPFQKMTGEGVPEKMRGDPFLNTRSPAIGFNIFPELLPAHPPTRTVDEKGRALLPFGKPFSGRVQIEGDPFHRFASERNDPLL
jgi:hypothetical protein